MHWDEKTTEIFLKQNEIKYSKYETVLGDCILDYEYCPYKSMLKYGQLNDTCSVDRTKPELIRKIVFVSKNDLVIFDPPEDKKSCCYQLVQRNGMAGDCQVGGTLESFLKYINAWVSLINTSGPFVDD